MKIAIAGLGVVGGGVVKLLSDNAAEISARCGESFEIVAVSARQKRDGLKYFANPLDLATTEADIIVELIGGEAGAALDLVKAALKNKKHVVTANKAMLAHHGAELAALAETNNVQLRYEAAVAGGIPVIKVLREGLAGNKINSISGILNGTCNYILTQMEVQRKEFTDILHEAQEKGYAEADPKTDIGGFDAAHKLCLLAALAFGKKPNFKALQVEGIEKIKLADIDFAKKLGYRIKHLCFASAMQLAANPCLLPQQHALAGIDDVYNAVQIAAEPVGKLVLYGRGAGAGPTASAVIADLIDIAQKRHAYMFNMPHGQLGELKLQAAEKPAAEYYLRLRVEDKAGVLEEVTAVFKNKKISIHKFLQDDADNGSAHIIIITHEVSEALLLAAVADLAKLESSREPPQMLRIAA